MNCSYPIAMCCSAVWLASCAASKGGSGGTEVENPDGPRPPHHVIVAQGPTDSTARYALVTWDRSDPSADAYEVLRDGSVIGSVTVKDDPWDDTQYQDTSTEAGEHDYTVRALAAGKRGVRSEPFEIRIRSDADFGTVYEVDSYSGTDTEKIDAAIKAATDAGGGVVKFSPRTYKLAKEIRVTGNHIVLRGAGIDQTILQADYEGFVSEEACGNVPSIVYFKETRTSLTTKLAAPVKPGDRTVTVTNTSGLAVGQVILLDESHDEMELSEPLPDGVIMDPGTESDTRYPFEINEIVEISGNSVTFKYPFSYAISTSVPWEEISSCLHNGIERLTIQGRSAGEQTWYDGVWFQGADHYAADIKVQWTNRRVAELNGYNIRLVGIQGGFTGAKGWIDCDTGCRCQYKIQASRAANGLIVGATMGAIEDDRAMSLVTLNTSIRIVVRNSEFYHSQTYGVDLHGEGARHVLIENNYFSVGESGDYAVGLGNNTWGFDGPAIIRNNTFENNDRDIRVDQNSFGVRILDNISRGVTGQFVFAYGWAGPDTQEDLYGSMRMTIARNQVSSAADGIRLGADWGVYPYEGVRDVVVTDNSLNITGNGHALALNGDSSLTNRFQVSNNSGSASYIKPEFVAGDYWSGNADGITYGSPTTVQWTAETLPWEEFDRN